MSHHATTERVTPVAIVGAGPVGLSLALGLARQGVQSTLVEREPGLSQHSKAPILHVRTREIFQCWGVEERFLAAGNLVPRFVLHNATPDRRPFATLDLGELDHEAAQPGVVVLEQSEIERLLLAALRETGRCDVRFGSEAVALRHDADGATLTTREGGEEQTLAARFVVGCDGASSFVRRALGLPFEGLTYTLRPMLADVNVEDRRDALPWPRLRNDPGRVSFVARLRPGCWRLVSLDH